MDKPENSVINVQHGTTFTITDDLGRTFQLLDTDVLLDKHEDIVRVIADALADLPPNVVGDRVNIPVVLTGRLGNVQLVRIETFSLSE